MEKLKEFWENLSPDAKRYTMYGIGSVIMLSISYMFVVGGEKIDLASLQKKPERKTVTPLVGSEIKGMSIDRVKGEMELLKEKQRRQNEEIKRLKRELKSKQHNQASSGRTITEAQIRKLIEAEVKKREALTQVSGDGSNEGGVNVKSESIHDTGVPKGEVDRAESHKDGDRAVIKTPAEDGNPFDRPTTPYAYNQPNNQAGSTQSSGSSGTVNPNQGQHHPRIKIRTVEPSKSVVAQVTGDINKIPYIPMGSMITGVFVTGMDASTGQNAQKNPYPALIRIKKEAVLPNRFSQDVRECFVLASGYGDLSSERVHLRSEGISCVREDGKPIEVNAKMIAVGEDGKEGLRGRVVDKEGQLLAKSLAAGVLSGFSSAFNQQAVPTISLNPTGTTPFQSAFSKQSAQSGLVKGTSSALDRLAQFYLDAADQIFPVIEIDAMRRVTFIVESGFALNPSNNDGIAPSNGAKRQ